MRIALLAVLVVMGTPSCKKDAPAAAPGQAAPAPAKKLVVGLVTDVGGRGDQSFNDSALRGLELWAGESTFAQGSYAPAAAATRSASIPPELAATVTPVPVKPLVVQSKAQEDYQPNLQLLVDQGAALTVGVGFMLENAVEAVAGANPGSRFLLIDSPLLDASGAPKHLPNVRTVVFREEEGSFLAGALAGLVAKSTVGFVGGMQIPLITKFEVGFRAGVMATNPKATVMVQYTGTFDNAAAGKQVANDLVLKGAEVVFHAAGSDGVGAIQSIKDARAAGKNVYAIGVDSDQSHLAPEAVLTSMVKRVDLAVWRAVKDAADGSFSAGDAAFGLKENGVGLAEVRVELPGKAEKLAAVEALRAAVVSGAIKVPSNQAELKAFVPPAPPTRQ